MTFPNPANYYLPVAEQIEAEVYSLNLKQLTRLHYQLSHLLDDLLIDQTDSGFDSDHMSIQFDDWVCSLKNEDLINVIRWTAERLAYLYRKEAYESKA